VIVLERLYNSYKMGGSAMTYTNSTDCWDSYLMYGERRFFKKKAVVYRENSDGEEGFYYLKKGLIKISTTIHTGEQSTIDIVCDEKPFGEQTADGEVYFSTASAIEDSIVYFFPYENIVTVMGEDEKLRMLMYNSLTEKLKVLSTNLLFHSFPSEKKLARTILILREKFASENIPFTQKELSRYTDLNRITIYNIFKKWEGNVVSIHKRKIKINNINNLKKIAAMSS